MRPQLHKLLVSPDASFVCREWNGNYFDKPWHFHKEYELVLIEGSEGTRFIGDDVSLFGSGEMVLIGPNLPHLFRSSEEHYIDPTKKARSVFIHFTHDFLGPSFFETPELAQVRRLLDKSALGIQIGGATNLYVRQRMNEMLQDTPGDRLVKLLDILVLLSTSRDLSYILNKSLTTHNVVDADKIDRVFQYIMLNFRNEIYVEKIAAQLNMSIPAFSRYFKRHTRKTFCNYVTEIRIRHACKLLMEGNHTTAEIGYLSGFENQSNFYRHFKKQTGVIPKAYKQRCFLLQPA